MCLATCHGRGSLARGVRHEVKREANFQFILSCETGVCFILWVG